MQLVVLYKKSLNYLFQETIILVAILISMLQSDT